MMKAKLFCKTGQLSGATFDIQPVTTIGKNAENTIQLYPALISGNHARISFDEKSNGYFLEDLNSRNGTRLDGMRVRGKERLGNLNVVTFADTFDFFFQFLDASGNSAPDVRTGEPVAGVTPKAPQQPKTELNKEFTPLPQIVDDAKQKTVFDDGTFLPPPILEEKKDKPSDERRTKVGVEFSPLPSFSPESARRVEMEKAAGRSYVLIFETLKGGPKSFDLKEGSTIVGRDSSCGICIDDGSVSRKHSEFVFRLVSVKGFA
ncbi:MAG: FHA domain-containing protein [bacterium]